MSHKNLPTVKETPTGKQGLRGESVSRLRRAFGAEAWRLASLIQFHGNELRPGPLLSMVVAWFLDQPEEVRNEIVERGRTLYESISDPPKRTKRRNGDKPPVPSGPAFEGGRTKAALDVAIPGKVNRGSKRRSDQKEAIAEVNHSPLFRMLQALQSHG